MAETFAILPEYAYEVIPTWNTQQTPFTLGYVQTRARWPRPKRKFVLRWQSMNQVEKEQVVSFFHNQVGAAGSFNYSPADPLDSPDYPGAVSQVAGGVLSSRTYYYGITWTTSVGETRVSTQRSIALAVNTLFSIQVPKFPSNVTSAKVYVGNVSGDLRFQATVSTSAGTTTEDAGGYVFTGAVPPSTNAATETLLVHLMEDEFTISKVAAGVYSTELMFEEVF